jgi:uracil-DNA glycosylase
LSAELAELLDDLRERARMYGALTSVGVARGAAPSAVTAPPAIAAPPVPSRMPVVAGDPGGLTDLPGVRDWVGDCQRCKLAGGRKNIVFGQGNPNAALMFVGEAPGADEDEQGLAFVGRAGQLLTDIIEKGLKIPRADVYIANVLKCVRYSTLVRLENGSWERIGRLVAQRYAGRVMTVDGNGTLTTRPVVGWHRTPLAGRRVFRISHRSSRARGGNRHGSHVTEDHPVLTRRGWVQARCLQPSDQIAIGHGLSVVAHDVIIGSMLGDGTLNKSSSYMALVHSRKQAEYLKLKAQALSELRPVVYEGSYLARKEGKRHETIACRTRASRAVAVLRDRFYPDGVKRIPADLEISARALAIWFLDDGYMRIRSANMSFAEIACHCFPAEAIDRLLAILRHTFRLVGYTRASSPGRIHFGSEASVRLSEIVAPFCPPSMRYKLHPHAEGRFAFDPDLYSPGVSQVMFDEVVVEPYEEAAGEHDYFCIDVDETHNFVTSGGVVHNCRPPGNRNPEPDEIRSCQPFLEKQIELISPRVLVGLGKFAGQWLLKTAEPISRIRGRVGDYHGIKVVPTYHPAYLLRNPSAKKEVWEDMKLVRSLLAD